MKKVLFIGFITLLMASCKKDVIRGNGDTITAERTVAPFNGIDVSGDGIVSIAYAPTTSVVVKGYSNLVPRYITEVRNGILYLHYEDNLQVKNNQLSVILSMPAFQSLSLSGSCSVTAAGNFDSTGQLSISTSGNGHVDIDHLKTNLYTLQSSGNSSVSTIDVLATNAKIDISGNGTAAISVRDKLEVNISGNGKVSYAGNPATISTNISGNGTLIKL